MKVDWFEGGKPLNSGNAALIEKWVEEHSEEIHEIYHLVEEYEMEVVKVIDGRQDESPDGGTTITSYDLYIIVNAVMVIMSEEVQAAGSNESTRHVTYLGEVEVPCDLERED